MDCDETGFAAPRLNCPCRACYRAREDRIPRSLAEFISEQTSYVKPPHKLPGPAIEMVRRCLIQYCAGRVTLDVAYTEFIKQLVTQSSEEFDRRRTELMLRPLVLPIEVQ